MANYLIGLTISQPLCFYSENVFKEISIPGNINFRELYFKDIYWDSIDNIIQSIKTLR